MHLSALHICNQEQEVLIELLTESKQERYDVIYIRLSEVASLTPLEKSIVYKQLLITGASPLMYNTSANQTFM